MKGFWRHIAASASITAVFIVCALALAFSSVPVAAPPAHVPGGGLGVSLTESCAGFLQGLGAGDGKTSAAAPSAAAPGADDLAQPDPATAAPTRADHPVHLLKPAKPWLSALN